MNLSGKTTAILQRCSIRAKKAGIQAFETVYGVFTDCTISECGEAGLQAQDRARLHVERLVLLHMVAFIIASWGDYQFNGLCVHRAGLLCRCASTRDVLQCRALL